MDIKRLDKWFGALCLFTCLAGISDMVISFYSSIHVALIATGAIWLGMSILWCWTAFKFRRMAEELDKLKSEFSMM